MINAINNVIKANCRSMLTTVYTYFDGGTSALLDRENFQYSPLCSMELCDPFAPWTLMRKAHNYSLKIIYTIFHNHC
jgi:hypothetical protein